MQLQEPVEVCSMNSEGLWCHGESQPTDQSVLKVCVVELVDIRKTQALNSKTTSGGNLPAGGPDESSMFDGIDDQETSMDYGKTEAEGEYTDEDFDREYSNSECMASKKSGNFNRDHQTLHAQLKRSWVRLVDCRKIRNRNAAAEDEVHDRDLMSDDFIPSSKICRFDRDQQTLEAQLKVCLVRLVDCGKVQNRKATAEDEHESRCSYLKSSSKMCRLDRDQQTLEDQLKVCLVRLVDCGKVQSRKATAEDEPEHGAHEHETP